MPSSPPAYDSSTALLSEDPGTLSEEPGTASLEPGTLSVEPGTLSLEPGTAYNGIDLQAHLSLPIRDLARLAA